MLLRVDSGIHEGWAIRLGTGAHTLGRNRDNDIILLDRWVSRRHCQINPQDNQWVISDLDSTHGTKVNGQRIEGSAVLNDYSTIELGQVQLTAMLQPQSDELLPDPVASVQEFPAVLRIETGPMAGREFNLENLLYTVGRNEFNDITIPEPTISRRHCLIGHTHGEWYIMDMNSTHGVLVDGEPVTTKQVLHGHETLHVGDVVMTLRFFFQPSGTAAGEIKPDPLVLRLVDGLHAGWEIPLVHPSYTLGRARFNDVILTDPSISRVHALFLFEEQQWVVEDLGSSLGVIVDDKPVRYRQELVGGESMRLGDVNLRVSKHFSPEVIPETFTLDLENRRRRVQHRLKILKMMPIKDVEQTFSTIEDAVPAEVLDVDAANEYEPISPQDRFADYEDYDQEAGAAAQMMKTVDLQLPRDQVGPAEQLQQEEFVETYSMKLTPAQREEIRQRYRHKLNMDVGDEDEAAEQKPPPADDDQ